jgi:hypothetical protein
MSISGVTGTSSQSASTTRPDPMANVESTLHLSAKDLRDALRKGSSLSDLASQQGVSRDDLLSAIEKDQQNRPARPGSADATPADPAAEAAKIADAKGLPHGHHHHHGGGGTSTGSATAATTAPAAISAAVSSGGSVSVLL